MPLIRDNPGCQGCPLYEHQCSAFGKFTRVEGEGTLGVLIVGEASGEKEDRDGLPFRPDAPAGGVYRRAIRRAGWEDGQFWLTNILRCRPEHNWLAGAPWEREAIDYCSKNLDEIIERLKPKAIVALGGIAFREISGVYPTGRKGDKRTISYMRGYLLPSRYPGIPVVGTFHPSYLARGREGSGMGGQMKLLGLIQDDIRRAIRAAKVGEQPLELGDLIRVIPATLENARLLLERIKADPRLLVAWDLETPESETGTDEDAMFSLHADENGEEEEREDSLDIQRARIKTIQFSINPEEGICFPWRGEYIDIAREIHSLPNPKVAHNGRLFDEPIAKRHGCLIRGERHDTLDMFKHMEPDLPAHLQGVTARFWPEAQPWKHLAHTEAELYGVMDVVALQKIMLKLPMELRRQGIWESYRQWVVAFTPELEEIEERGIPIDRSRLSELRDKMEGDIRDLDEEIQILAPDGIKLKTPLEGYTNLLGDLKEFVFDLHPEFTQPMTRTFKNGASKEIKNKTKPKDVYKMLLDGQLPETLAALMEKYKDLRIGDFGGEKRLYHELPFLPGSTQQLQAYLTDKGLRVPTRFKDGKPTTGDKELRRLGASSKDPLISLVRERRRKAKVRDSYTGKYVEGELKGGWEPQADGRLRAQFTFKSTGQLAAKGRANVLTPLRRREEAPEFRRVIRAEPGHKMITIDMAGFHALMTGFEARDKVYMDLTRKDIHSYVTGWVEKWPGMEYFLEKEDGEQLEILGAIKGKYKKVRDDQVKPLVHGTNFGEGYRRVYYESSEHFANEGEAKKLHDLLKFLFPLVFKWQKEVVEEADDQGYLRSRYNFIRRFREAMRWQISRTTGKWERVEGADADKAKAFKPSNNAHIYLRHKIIQAGERGWNRKYQLVLLLHDEVQLHCPNQFVEEALYNYTKLLEEPEVVLTDPLVAPEGLWCGTEAKVGEDLGSMTVVRV